MKTDRPLADFLLVAIALIGGLYVTVAQPTCGRVPPPLAQVAAE